MSDPTTPYEELLQKAEEAAELHPRSYVVIDAVSHELLGNGTDPEKLFRTVRDHLKPGQVPMVYKKPKKGEILIL